MQECKQSILPAGFNTLRDTGNVNAWDAFIRHAINLACNMIGIIMAQVRADENNAPWDPEVFGNPTGIVKTREEHHDLLVQKPMPPEEWELDFQAMLKLEWFYSLWKRGVGCDAHTPEGHPPHALRKRDRAVEGHVMARTDKNDRLILIRMLLQHMMCCERGKTTIDKPGMGADHTPQTPADSWLPRSPCECFKEPAELMHVCRIEESAYCWITYDHAGMGGMGRFIILTRLKEEGMDAREEAKTITRKGEVEYRILLEKGAYVKYTYEKPDGSRERKFTIALDTGEKYLLIPLREGKFLAIPEVFDDLSVYDPASGRIIRFKKRVRNEV